MSLTAKTKAELALLGTTLIWGSTFTAQKIGLQNISPLLLILVRFSVATVVFALLFRSRLFPIPFQAVVKGAILGLFLFLGFAVQTVGLQYTTASKSAFITSMMVVFVPLLQIIVERRSPNIGNILGVIIVSGGLWVLTAPSGAAFNQGDLLTLLSAILFAVYIVYLDVISQEMPTAQLTFLQFATVGVLSLPAVVFFEDVTLSPTPHLVASLAYLTLLATLFTTYIQTRFQKDTTPTKAAIIFTIEPVFAAIISYAVLGEYMGAFGILGGGLIVSGILLSELSDGIPFLNKSFGL